MKKSIFMVATALFTMLVAACTKDNELPIQEEVKSMPITITANYKGDNAKVSYTESGKTISAKWQSGDKILVAYDGRVSTLSLDEGAGSTSATFTGTIYYTHAPSANSILSCYVKDQNNSSALVDNGDGTIIYTNDAFLNQNGTVAGAGKCNTFFGMAKFGDGTDIKCEFSVNTSILKLTAFAPYGVTSGSSATLTYQSGSVTLAKATFTVGANGRNYIYMAVPAGSYSGEQTIVYKSGETEITRTLSADHATFSIGQIYSKALTFGYINLANFSSNFEAQDGDIISGTPSSSSITCTIPNGTVTLKDVSAENKYLYIRATGDATIVLDGTNILRGSSCNINVTSGNTLTIQGSGSLDVSNTGYGHAAIGSFGSNKCGNIIIKSGTITATATSNNAAGIGCGNNNECGNITIQGGSVTATGSLNGAGIGAAGTGNSSKCGNITITSDVTSVTAIKGSSATASIGKGHASSVVGTVTIGGTVYWNGSAYQNNGEDYLTQNSINYAPSAK